MHSVTVDRARSLIEVRLTGFFSPEMTRSAGEEVRDAIRSLGPAAGQHLTMYDVADVSIAPGTTMEILQKIFANPAYRPLWARKLAFFTGSALARMQLARLREARSDIGIFEDRQTALRWLLD
jgi:hypothetical protein